MKGERRTNVTNHQRVEVTNLRHDVLTAPPTYRREHTNMPETTTDICVGYEGAPFCEGESLKSCGWNIEVPENEDCPPIEQNRPDQCWNGLYVRDLDECPPLPGNAKLADGALGSPDPVDSCETDGSCDDSCTPPARGDCTIAQTAEPAPPELPVTGLNDPVPLSALALALFVLGTLAIKITRRN